MIECPICSFQLIDYNATCQRCTSRSQSGQCSSYDFATVPVVPNIADVSLLSAQVPAAARSVPVVHEAVVVPAVPIPSSTTTIVHQQPVMAQAFPVASRNQIPILNTSNVQSIGNAERYSSYPYNPEYVIPNNSNPYSAPTPSALPPEKHPTGRRMKDGSRWGSFIGQLNNRGERHGFGSMKYDDGSQYEGLWKNNLKDGSGALIYSTGPKLLATWVNNKVHGGGTYYYPDGRVDLRTYHKGECIGDGVQYSQDRQVASKLHCGRVKKWISLTKASRIVSKMGLEIPRSNANM